MRRRSVELWLAATYVVSLLMVLVVLSPPAHASGHGYYVVTVRSEHRVIAEQRFDQPRFELSGYAPVIETGRSPIWTGVLCHAVWTNITYHDFGVDIYAIKVWGNWCSNGTGGLVKWQWAKDFALYKYGWSWCGWQNQIRQSGNVTGSSGWASDYVKGCMSYAFATLHTYPSLKMTVYGSGKYIYSGKAY